jgi:hypothetical protein
MLRSPEPSHENAYVPAPSLAILYGTASLPVSNSVAVGVLAEGFPAAWDETGITSRVETTASKATILFISISFRFIPTESLSWHAGKIETLEIEVLREAQEFHRRDARKVCPHTAGRCGLTPTETPRIDWLHPA